MKTKRAATIIAVLIALSASVTFAQQEPPSNRQPAGTTVTASAGSAQVRFTAAVNVTSLRVEVYSEAGNKVFDSQSRDGNVLDWSLQDQQQTLPDGAYLCVVTVKNLAGKVSRKLATIAFEKQLALLQPVEKEQLTTAQAHVLNGTDANASLDSTPLTILTSNDPVAATIIANDGAAGQLSRTRGPLTFRLGDFFSGNDQEQMRLTEDGKLGIGTSKPKAKLDVAGPIRAREGFMFADGSRLNINDKGVLTRTAPDGTTPTAVSSTQNKIAKFTDNAGTVGDSLMTETGGQVGIGTAAPASLLHLAGPSGVSAITLNTPGSHRFRFQTVAGVPNWGALTLNANYNGGWLLDETATNGWFFKLDTRGGNADGPNNGLWLFKIPSGPNPHTDEGPVFGVSSAQAYFAGKVGIGNTAPAAKLDVSGDVNTTTQYNISGNRVLSASADSGSTSVGIGSGTNNTGPGNSFFGNNAGNANTSGLNNAFFGSGAGLLNTIGSNNAFFGVVAGNSNSEGVRNSFFGGGAGFSNTLVSDNSFFGNAAGFSNLYGTANSFFGSGAGAANQFGSYNSFFGFEAGASSTAFTSSLYGNSFFGAFAGHNSTGEFNSFFGGGAGYLNTSGMGNTFVGNNAGIGNMTGNDNSYFGNLAGSGNTGESTTLIGARTFASNNLTFATALGAGARVSTNNTIALGRSDGSDVVEVPGKLQIDSLVTGGTTQLCLNGSNRVGTCSSSLRYKKNLAPYSHGLNIINLLRPISFNWKDSGVRDLGFGAEDVEKIDPLLVIYNASGKVEGVKYDRISVVLVNAVRDQQAQLNQQQEEIKRQAVEIAALKQIVCTTNPATRLCQK